MITKKRFNRILIDLEKNDSNINLKIGKMFINLNIGAFRIADRMANTVDNYQNNYIKFCQTRIKKLKFYIKRYLI